MGNDKFKEIESKTCVNMIPVGKKLIKHIWINKKKKEEKKGKKDLKANRNTKQGEHWRSWKNNMSPIVQLQIFFFSKNMYSEEKNWKGGFVGANLISVTNLQHQD